MQTVRSVLAHVGLISAVQTTGADTWKKQALYHMPGWLTLAEQVQTPYPVITTNTYMKDAQ